MGKQALVIGLIGELGSGKTTFVQDFARELGIKERVISPTFVILKKYEIRSTKSETNSKIRKFKTLIHIDVYRLDSEKDMRLLGWEEMIKNPENIIMIEWADRIKNILPKDVIIIRFKHAKENTRKITIENS